MTWFEWQSAPKGDFAVVGDPISHSLSPVMHRAAYAELRLGLEYHAIRVPAGQLGMALEHLAELGYRGVNVTLPLKEEAFLWADRTEGIGQWLGVVNTLNLESKSALNTDAPGFLSTLSECGVAPGSSVMVLGAGGTARGLIPALVEASYKVSAWNRTRIKLDDFVWSLAIDVEVRDEADPSGCDVVVNTTSVAQSGGSLPIDWSRADENCLAYDVSYSKEATQFLKQATEFGLRTQDGLKMLVAQGALSFEWWLGKSAPRTVMIGAIHEYFKSNA